MITNYDDDEYQPYNDAEFEFDSEMIERMNCEAELDEENRKAAYDAAMVRLDELADLIKSWDCSDASDLCGYLNEFEDICEHTQSIRFNEDYLDCRFEYDVRKIDLCELPCADVDLDNSDMSGIYAVDSHKNVVYPTQQGWDYEKFDPETDYLTK